MIDGLKLQMSSAELEAHLEERRAHHEERATFYRRQVDALRDGGVRPEAITNDPLSSLEKDMQRHQNKQALMAFMRDHVVPDETYQLDESDLARLEIIDRGW